MTDVSITVLGADRIGAGFGALTAGLTDLAEPTAAAMAMIAGDARRRAPKRSGRLAASITAAPNTVYSNLIYAPVIHYGSTSRNIRANPFLAAAGFATEPVWVDAFEDHLDTLTTTF